MKRMKKVFALLLTMVMVLAMAVPAMAANDGSITIDNTTNGATYSIYKVFDATYSGTKVSYTYDGSNTTFLSALQGTDSPFAVTLNSNGTYNVSAKDTATAATISTFLTNQKANLGTPTATSGTGGAVTFSNLGYGYYYVTTTTGTAVTINSAVKDVTVIDKNDNTPNPPVKKASANGATAGESTTASINDKINFEITGTVKRYGVATEGADAVKVTKLTYVDTMSTGLTLNQDVAVTIGGISLTKDTHYTVNYSGQITTINIPMVDSNEDFLYAEGAAIVITYSGTLNENAVVAGSGNTNTVELKWNDSNTSGTDTAIVYTYSFDLVKDNKSKEILNGAEFTLKKDNTTIYFTKDSDGNYKVTSSETEGATSKIEAGHVKISGLGNGSYTLTETKAPEGYIALTEPVTVTVNGANNDATVKDTKYVSGGVEVVNEAGTALPSTGGIGTTIFYVIGAVCVLGAGVLLVTRRRMASK